MPRYQSFNKSGKNYFPILVVSAHRRVICGSQNKRIANSKFNKYIQHVLEPLEQSQRRCTPLVGHSLVSGMCIFNVRLEWIFKEALQIIPKVQYKLS